MIATAALNYFYTLANKIVGGFIVAATTIVTNVTDWFLDTVWWGVGAAADWIVAWIPNLSNDPNYVPSLLLEDYVATGAYLANVAVVWTVVRPAVAGYFLCMIFGLVVRLILFGIRWIWGSN